MIHDEVAFFASNPICLSALEYLRLCNRSPVSVRYLRVEEEGEKTVLWKPTSFKTSPSNGPEIIHIPAFQKVHISWI